MTRAADSRVHTLSAIIGPTFGDGHDPRSPDATVTLPSIAPIVPGVGYMICTRGEFPLRP